MREESGPSFSQNLLDRAYAIQRTLEVLFREQYISPESRYLIELLLQLLDDISAELVEGGNQLRGILVGTEWETKIGRRITALELIHTVMLHAYSSRTEAISPAIVHLMRDLLSSRVKSRLPLTYIIAPFPFLTRESQKAHLSSYAYASEPNIGVILRLITSGFQRRHVPEDFAVLWFPAAEKNNVLLHCCLVHELCHQLQRPLGWSQKVAEEIFRKQDMQQRIEQEISKLREGQQAYIVSEAEEDYLRTRIATIVRNWIIELICDVGALYLVGPAYFFAFVYYMSVTTDLYAPSQSHPFFGRRLRIMLEVINRHHRGFLSKAGDEGMYWQRVAADVDAEAARTLRQRSEARSYRDRILYLSAMLAEGVTGLKDLPEVIERVVGADIDCYGSSTKPEGEQELKRVIELFECIRTFTPPVEIVVAKEGRRLREPADFRTILNAGWLAFLTLRPKLFDEYREARMAAGEVDGQQMQIAFLEDFHKLIAYAIEMAWIEKEIRGRKARADPTKMRSRRWQD